MLHLIRAFAIAILLNERVNAFNINRGLFGSHGDSVKIAARQDDPVGINVAAVSARASAYGSSIMASASVKAYAKPTEAVTQFIALGDSFTAGVGSNGGPDYNSGSSDCSRYNSAYPYKLQNMDEWEQYNGGVTPVLNFGACTGAKMQDLLDNQINLGDGTWRDVEYHDFGRPQIAVMTIGGNDVGFVDILNACVFRYSPFPGDCQQLLKDASTLIQSEDFEIKLIDTLSRVALRGRSAKGAVPVEGFQVYVAGYIPFWNDVDTGCDTISWGFWGRSVPLKVALRKQMNDLVGELNTMIKTVADGLKEFLGVIYVDGFQTNYLGHQFCDPASQDYLYNPVGSQTWFWSYYSGDWQSGSEGPDPPPPTGASITSSPSFFNLTLATMEILLPKEDIAQVTAENPPYNFNPSWGAPNMSQALDTAQGVNRSASGLLVKDQPGVNDRFQIALSELVKRIFHPKGTAYGFHAFWFLAAIKANRDSPPATTCQGNKVSGTCTSGSYGNVPDFTGIEPPSCFKADGASTEIYYRLNAPLVKEAAQNYCIDLVTKGTVLKDNGNGPQPWIVHGVGEKNTDLVLSVLYDKSSCPSDKSMTTLDFAAYTSGSCVDSFFTSISQTCEQDSTWPNYDSEHTLLGGTFMNSCALWTVKGILPEDNVASTASTLVATAPSTTITAIS